MIQISESIVFEVIPYVGTNSVAFGMNPLQVERVLGKSELRSKNYRGKLNEYWSGLVIGYSESGGVDHIGFEGK
jgi:hypothetical protein